MKEEQGGVCKRKKMAVAVGRRSATGKAAADRPERYGCPYTKDIRFVVN
jgi:hypothetical protein